MMQPIYISSLSLLILSLASCNKENATTPHAMPPAAVSFQPAASENVSILREFPGRLDALRVAEVRARVPGILLEKTFEEGADVQAGDVLFKIDPAPLEAAKSSAEATLARAEANLHQSETVLTRYRELADSNAISRQDLDNAEAAKKVADAEILAAKAALQTAELNLGYTSVTAPISGRSGKAQVTEGALVGQGDATLLAVIQQLDPIYFDFTQSSAELLAIKRAMNEGSVSHADEAQPVTLILDDGSTYEHKGKVLFSEAAVDASTGMVSLRAEFPNPERLLLPGMFAKIRMVLAVRENAVTIPQRAVTRIQGGSGSVLIVDDENNAQIRIIETSDAIDDKWVVTSGLKPGEKVIIEGHLKARPGAPVVPEPFQPQAENPATDSSATSDVENG